MLYSPDRHLKYIAYQWNDSQVRATIRDILNQTRDGLDISGRLWPIHPKDKYEGAQNFLTEFYFGAAGVLWAVGELVDYAERNLNLPPIDEVLSRHLEHSNSNPDSPFCGELGIRFVKQTLTPSLENSNALKSLIRQAAMNNCREILYGGPGALAMAHLLWKNGDESFRELCVESVRFILEQRETDEISGAQIWSQQLGVHRKFIGAAHGSVGNFGVLIRALKDLGETKLAIELIRDAEKFLSAYAVVEDDLVNWSRGADGSQYSALMVIHWCHGATGIVTDLSECISADESPVLNDLFSKAANLVWKAGPLQKGVSLCHGTAGSGLACLKMFERSQDDLWLERARGLAMFAIKQYEAELAKVGQARFSLWTGDLGLAIFLRDVLDGRGCLPGLSQRI